jgi:hypothetical protein
MKFAKNLLTNKYVLYVVLFLAVISVFGYISLNNTHAVIVFVFIGLISRIFTKNMIIILGLSIIITHLLVATKSYKEGLENNDKKDEKVLIEANTTNSTSSTSSSNNNPTNEEVSMPVPVPVRKEEEKEPEPMMKDISTTNTMNSDNNKGGSSRIDYASTLEEAYDNLDSILGSKGIQGLTNETQKLMEKQQQLFKSMESMAPMLGQAKEMLQKEIELYPESKIFIDKIIKLTE